MLDVVVLGGKLVDQRLSRRAGKRLGVKRARHLGFALKDIAVLLNLWQDRDRASAEVKALAASHIDEIDQRMKELRSMRETLTHLVRNCRGDDRPDCPILAGLAGEADHC